MAVRLQVERRQRERRTSLIGMRCTDKEADWIRRLAKRKKCGSVTALLRLALNHLADSPVTAATADTDPAGTRGGG